MVVQNLVNILKGKEKQRLLKDVLKSVISKYKVFP